MEFERIVKTVKHVLAQKINSETIREMPLSTSLVDDLGLDSMSILTFLVTLEETIPDFSIDANTLEAGHVNSIGSICEYVQGSLKSESA